MRGWENPPASELEGADTVDRLQICSFGPDLRAPKLGDEDQDCTEFVHTGVPERHVHAWQSISRYDETAEFVQVLSARPDVRVWRLKWLHGQGEGVLVPKPAVRGPQRPSGQ